MLKSKLIRYGKIIVPIAIICIIVIQGRKELSGLSLRDALRTIENIPHGGFYWAVLVGLIAVLTMFFYDYLLLRSLGAKASLGKTLRVSWIANSFNGVLGFGGLAGASLRALMYRPYVKEPKQLIKAIAWMAPSLGSGLSILAFLAIVNLLPVRQVLHEVKWLWLALVGVFAVLPAYIFLSKWKGKEMASAKTTTLYTIVSFIEWTSAGITSYLILALLDMPITFTQAMGAYVIAAVAGTISMVPGGIGSFDLVYIIALQTLGVDKSVVLSALLLFRLVYYFIPFGVGLVVAAFEAPGVVAGFIEEQNGTGRQTRDAWGVLWSIQRVVLERLGDLSLAALTFMTGTFMLLSMIMPVYTGDIERLLLVEPDWLVPIFSGLTLGFGLVLLGLTRGIYRRTKRSYWLAIFAIGGGGLACLMRGMNWKISLFIFGAGLLLFLLRGQFTRVRSELTTVGAVFFMLVAGGILFLYYTVCIVILMVSLSPEFELSDIVVQSYAGINVSTAFAAIFVPLYLLIGAFLYDRMHNIAIGEPARPQRLKQFLENHGGHELSHLGYTGDKWFYFSSNGKMLIQFAKKGNRLVVLGDPSGDPASFREGLGQFLDESDRLGYRVVFYQIHSDLMPLYHDLGFRYFKLGEEAVVDLTQYSLNGKEHPELFELKERFEKNGYLFELVEPPIDNSMLQMLKRVSDAFMGNEKERRFSLGCFDLDYVKRAPIGVLRNRKGEVEAFVSILPAYKEGEISIDLIRSMPDAPEGILNCVLLHLIDWAKERGYRKFNLGMTPLSNEGQAQRSFLLEQIAGAIFRNVNQAYGLSGDRAFKESYDPIWESKYLAYRRNRSLPWTIFHVSRLIRQGGDPIRRKS